MNLLKKEKIQLKKILKTVADDDQIQLIDQTQILDLSVKEITFISNNLNYITIALTKLGKYKSFGYAGHHVNLVAQAVFKTVQSAAKLVGK